MQAAQGIFNYPDKLTLDTFFTWGIGHPASFIRRSLFEMYGNYDENYSIVSDWKFFIITMVQHNCSYKHINTTISYFESGGISTDKKNKKLAMQEREDVLRKLFPMMYDDYLELQVKRSEQEFYLNSKTIQLVKKIQQSILYKKLLE